MNEGCAVSTSSPGSRPATDRGFTLVELLIVIVLLGIIAAVTVFAVRGVSDKGKVNVCLMDRRMLETAVESYLVEFPAAGMPDETDLVVHGLLRGPSPNWDIDSSGNVVAQVGGPNDCIL
jgi:general secretion pathway protein G